MADYQITLRKRYSGYQWVNAYSIDCPDLPTAHTFATGALTTFEKAITWTSVEFMHARTSLLPDPSRQAFLSSDLTGNGAASLTGETEPAQVVLYVALNADSGFPGRKFYRFALGETEVVLTSEGAALNGTSAQTRFSNALTNLNAALVAAGIDLTVGLTRKTVTSLSVVGPRFLDTRHGWFNRTQGA